MAIKVVIHSPAGGQGKTTLTANLSMMLADKRNRVLAVDVCSSKGLQIYFNIEAGFGVSELLSGTPAGDLIGEIRPNLKFLPGGDLVEAENILSRDKLSPFLNLEKYLKEVEDEFDYILFDTSPTEDSRLFFAVLYYVDKVLVPIETKQAGVEKIIKFRELLEGVNPRLREKEGKPSLSIGRVVPYWYSVTRAKVSALEILQREFTSSVTNPIGECTGLIEAMTRGESLADRLKNVKNPRANEAHILSVYKDIIKYIAQE